jgi:hypothetical protein
MTSRNNYLTQLKFFVTFLIFLLLGLLTGCNGMLLSERQKVVRASHDAVCNEKDFKAMRPFLSKSSLPILDLSTSIANIGQIFLGGALSDRIAVECHSAGQSFVDEIKVTDERYIVRTKNSGSAEVVETVVILENGIWKISILGL